MEVYNQAIPNIGSSASSGFGGLGLFIAIAVAVALVAFGGWLLPRIRERWYSRRRR